MDPIHMEPGTNPDESEIVHNTASFLKSHLDENP